MLTDPFAPLVCEIPVGLVEALLRGIPDNGCLSLSLTPLTAFAAIAAIGIAIAGLQAVVRALVYGRAAPADGPNGYRRPAHEPPNSKREAANRARAAHLNRSLD